MNEAREDPPPPMVLRILRFPLVRLVLLGAALFLMMGVSNGFMVRFRDATAISIAVAAAMALLALAVYAGFVRLVEARSVGELTLRGFVGELGCGLLIGAGLFATSVLALIGLGVYRIDGLNPVVFLLPALPMAISSGVFEELLYRGVLFRIVEESLGSWIALAVSSLVFGLRHLANPDGTLVGALSLSVEAGLLLAAAYMANRRLWLCIGLHTAWNFAEAGIFSGIVSGAFSQPGLVRSTIQGPHILTGGAFGLEASIVSLVICASAGVCLLTLARRRNHIMPPRWRHSADRA